MTTDNVKAILSEYDFILVIDKSGSMGEKDMNGRSRWEAVQEDAQQFARDVCEIDADGIGVVLFSSAGIVVEDGCGPEKLKEIFENNRPGGSTPLDQALTAALKLAGKSSKKDHITVFTDGTPDNADAVANVIRAQANKQQADDECTILFLQVGRDAAATTYLKGLDDNLKGAKYDICDSKTIDEVAKFKSTAELIAASITD